MLTCIYICIFTFLYVKYKKRFLEWKHNRKIPRLTHEVSILNKRTQTDQFRIKDKKIGRPITTYYVTFHLPYDEQIELRIPEKDYRFLFQGDSGHLTFQGTKFFTFERTALKSSAA